MPGAKKGANGSQSDRRAPRKSVSGRGDISALFRSGARASGETLTLIYRPGLSSGRCSVFVPVRLGGPVARNRARRVLSEHIRVNPHPAMNGIDLIVLLKKSADRAALEKAKAEIRPLLDRIHKDN
ncbi:MAG TPA: ribonuclease P protein component [bacterium]|nr:MAG: ribonuclease P [bacterium ADurb.Bin236]HPI76827.1 ribonuclease P protein component [bacterium]HPN95239.1 ribonuclease P protein component [bacterium]